MKGTKEEIIMDTDNIYAEHLDTDKIYAEHLAAEYAPKDTSKIVALKKLDAKAKLPATIVAYVVGFVAILVVVIGICLSTGAFNGVSTAKIVFGSITSLIGISGTGLNYLLYSYLLKKGKEKYAADIVELANQISKS